MLFNKSKSQFNRIDLLKTGQSFSNIWGSIFKFCRVLGFAGSDFQRNLILDSPRWTFILKQILYKNLCWMILKQLKVYGQRNLNFKCLTHFYKFKTQLIVDLWKLLSNNLFVFRPYSHFIYLFFPPLFDFQIDQ